MTADLRELVDAQNRTAAHVARLESALRELIESTTEQNKVITTYIATMTATYGAIVQAQKPWWRRSAS